MLQALGGKAGHDRIAGFIYIGEKIKPPMERTRPDPATVITPLDILGPGDTLPHRQMTVSQ